MYKNHLFFGEDNYTSLKSLEAVKARFIKKYSSSSVVVIDCEQQKDSIKKELEEAITVRNLFSEEKLIIIKHVFSIVDEPVIDLIKTAIEDVSAEGTFILFWNREKPDKRMKIYKLLNKYKDKLIKYHESRAVQNFELKDWIKNFLQKEELNIDDSTVDLIFERVNGLSMWSVANYLNILACVCENEVQPEDVLTYIPKRFEMDNFAVTDSLLAKNSKTALRRLMPMLLARNVNYEEAASFMGALNWLIRTLIQIKYNQTSGVNPYVVRKMTPYVNNFSESFLLENLQLSNFLDEQIKSGKCEYSWAIEKLVWNFVQ